MTKIIIERSSEWNNKAREIGIYIDREKAGTINDGETQEYEVENGKHEIFAKIDWCRSQKIELNTIEGKPTVLKLTGFKYGAWILPICTGIMSFYFLGKYALKIDLNFLIGFALIGFLYPLYYITLGKNNYLTLKNKNL
ncbi:hypothetical protein LPB136_06450 [Tenacibaculum todarodis]|uniref:Uncharacterized protein n=1 Tax=Tenacibaculum todarodis TaxID=1850252 RepID=A0A1L3JIR4_9FLAO|nr:hypothetical protein [Tenacibaculum todarodis]APG65018.1 hypothetical protein LPB136_06450 [Tenacibaculum todarodis]